MVLKVLSALDTAKTQLYHVKAIIIAGMGLFTDGYDLLCILPIMGLIGRVYYENLIGSQEVHHYFNDDVDRFFGHCHRSSTVW
jgi:hypothetical protein